MIWRTGPFGGSMTKMSSATFLLSFWAVRYAEIGLTMYEPTPESMILIVAGVVPRKDVRRHRFLVESGDVLDRFDRLLAVEYDFLAGLVLDGAAIAPQQAAPRRVRIVAVAERNADRIALRFQLGAADPHIVPCVGLHPDLVPHALAVHAREIDVVIGKCRPRPVVLVVAELPADRADLAIFLLDGFDEIAISIRNLRYRCAPPAPFHPNRSCPDPADASAAARAATSCTGMWSTVTCVLLLPQSLANLSNHLSYAGTKWLHCTIDSVLVSASAREHEWRRNQGGAAGRGDSKPRILSGIDADR